ncbi:MAG: HEAT repeat domain-containing protein [Planctomycetes bacterium]|nr:HEAT repeat domain-containing protein [Planctomycetota bacterium]
MTAPHRLVPLLVLGGLLLAGVPRAQEPAAPPDVDRAIAAWRRSTDRTAERLTATLASFGVAAEPRLRSLVRTRLDLLALRGVASALARIATEPESAAAVAQLRESDEIGRRLVAVQALGEWGNDDALPALLASLDDTFPAVRAAARDALVQLARAHPELRVLQWLSDRRAGVGDQQSLMALLQTLAADAAAGVRVGELVDRWIREWLARERRDDAELTRQLAGLGSRAAPELRRWLAESLEDRSTARRARAEAAPVALALARIDPSAESIAVLVALQDQGVVSERVAAVIALGELGSTAALESLIAKLDDRVPEVRSAVVEAVLRIRAANPDQDLLAWHRCQLEALDHHAEVGQLLGRIGGSTAREMLTAMLEWPQDTDLTLAGLSGLWQCGQAEDIPAVLALLDAADMAIRRKACLVLGRLRATEAIPRLIGLLRGEQRGQSADAHWALQQITGQRLGPDASLWEAWWARREQGDPGRRP